jgi:hypothetical protein
MSSKPFTTLNSFSSDPWRDSAVSQNLTIMPTVIGFVGVQFLWPFSRTTWLAPDRRNDIQHHFQRGRFMYIRRRMPYDERDALPFDHKMALRARFSAIRRVGASGFAPPGAGTLPASNEARDQSNCLASDSLSNNTRWSRSHTPACCQSRNRRQQVIPLPQPISKGNISQGMPVLSTNSISPKAAPSETRGRPPLGFSPSGGNKGSITCQSSLLTSCFPIPQSYQFLGFC